MKRAPAIVIGLVAVLFLVASFAMLTQQPASADVTVEGQWTTLANGDDIRGLAMTGNVVWAGTHNGGVVRWDPSAARRGREVRGAVPGRSRVAEARPAGRAVRAGPGLSSGSGLGVHGGRSVVDREPAPGRLRGIAPGGSCVPFVIILRRNDELISDSASSRTSASCSPSAFACDYPSRCASSRARAMTSRWISEVPSYRR